MGVNKSKQFVYTIGVDNRLVYLYTPTLERYSDENRLKQVIKSGIYVEFRGEANKECILTTEEGIEFRGLVFSYTNPLEK